MNPPKTLTLHKLPATPDSAPSKEKLRLVTPRGRLVHLYTGVVFTEDVSRLVEVDTFVQAQIDAGKLLVSEE